MKQRWFLCLMVVAVCGMSLPGCAPSASQQDMEARLALLEDELSSYPELQDRVDALERMAAARGFMEPRLSRESLPPAPEKEEVAAVGQPIPPVVPGQREITPPPETVTGAAAPQGQTAQPGPPVANGRTDTAEPETPSPFDSGQVVYAAETASPFAATNLPETVASPFRADRNATRTAAQAGQPPLPLLDAYPPQAVKAAETSPPAVAAPPVAAPAPPQPAPNPAPRTEKGAYEAALALYEAGKLADSRRAMTQFIETYPNSAYVPNALYWIGEAYYSQAQWGEAIMSFKDVVSRFPEHAKAADSLLKLGMSYERLGDKDNARFHYEALLEDFPNSRAAGLAKPKLAAL